MSFFSCSNQKGFFSFLKYKSKKKEKRKDTNNTNNNTNKQTTNNLR